MCIHICWLLFTSQPSSWTTSSQALSSSSFSFFVRPLESPYILILKTQFISHLCDREILFHTSGYKPQSQEVKLLSLLLNKMTSLLLSSSSGFYFCKQTGWLFFFETVKEKRMMKRLKVKKLLPKIGLFKIPQQTSVGPNIFMPVQSLNVEVPVYPLTSIFLW